MAYEHIYVARSHDGDYVLGTDGEAFDGIGFKGPAHIDTFCSDDFEAVTGAVLEHGYVFRAAIHIKLLDEGRKVEEP